MRVVTALAALGLLASAYFAPRHHGAREPGFPVGRFVTGDARERRQQAERGRQLGVALAATEELARDHPDDAGAMRDRIRTVLLAGSVGLGQPNVSDLVYGQVASYLEQRDRLDPDGSFLAAAVGGWIEGRLHYDWTVTVYPRAAMAIFLAARGDRSGHEMLLELARKGMFHMQFFPFARRFHPGWPAAETLIVHYMEHGDVVARLEAGVTLLEYHSLFGVGDELVERHLPAIRSAVREMRQKMRAFAVEATDASRATIVGMALLASRGEEEELQALAAAKSERELLYYVPAADVARIARVWVGLDPFESMSPLTVRFKELDPLDQELYYVALAHRATKLAKEGGAGGTELAALLDVIESGFDGGPSGAKILAMQALLRLAPERGAALVARAIDGRGALGVYAGALADAVEDRASLFLPGLSSQEPDVSALAAVSIHHPDAPRALQR